MAKEAIGSRYQKDPKKIELIKRTYLDIHDALVDAGIFPSVRRVLKAMPFWVNEQLGTEIRKSLVEAGDLEPSSRGNPKASIAHEKRLGVHPEKEVGVDGMPFVRLSDVVTAARALAERYRQNRVSYDLASEERAVMARKRAEAMEVRRGARARGPVVHLGKPTNRDVARWAVERYRAATKSIRTVKPAVRDVDPELIRIHRRRDERPVTNATTANDLVWGEDWEDAS